MQVYAIRAMRIQSDMMMLSNMSGLEDVPLVKSILHQSNPETPSAKSASPHEHDLIKFGQAIPALTIFQDAILEFKLNEDQASYC
jgi:hypothetical protein